MQNTKPYIAINASAGSGKTYALVQRVLMICLKHEKQHDAIQHILALTFTNKAANEMKERILQWLKKFTQADYADNQDLKNIQEALKHQGTIATMEDLHRRSQKVLDYILHHYSTLNIGTIDKFNSKLVRSFSYELGLPHQFNLEIQSAPFLIEAVDKMLDEIGENEQISNAFLDFIHYNMDNEEKINLSNSLYRKAKTFISDIHYDELKNNAEFDWDAYEKTKSLLRNAIAEHKKNAQELTQQSIQLIQQNGLKFSHFSGGNKNSIAKFFSDCSNFFNGQRDSFPLNGSEENYRKLTASKDIAIRNAIESIIEPLIENRRKIIQHYIAAEKKNIILSEILPLKINKEIQEKLNEIEEENDLVLLSKFNILINENLKNEPSNFIYEKIGTRYQHFFFDEFQDTSKMQWQNILPLKEHTVAPRAAPSLWWRPQAEHLPFPRWR
ncbi:DNA helicase UvrD [Bergeyella porcorum]|uniref:DNA 3'-5' helicase II n=1 Tax=Bergeyella porcorum TaxID=1735111 RepID=A0AAU0F1A8_9FLAO